MQKSMTRRDVIRDTVTGVAAAIGWTQFAPLLGGQEKRRFKIGACDWSLRKTDPSSFEVARRIGLDGVQVSMGSAANNLWLRRPEIQKSYRDAAMRHGVEIASLAIGEMNNIALKSEPRAAIWLLDSIEVMKALGVKVVLIAQFYRGDLKGDKQGTDRTVEVLREIAPRAEQAGVILGLENYLSAEENLEILQRVASPAVQVYYDVGNSTDKGYDIGKEIRMLKGRICEFHFKDAGFLLGKGRIDFAQVRQAIEDIGYSGWAQIEAAAPNDLVSDYRENLRYLRNLFS
ncbi:MAG: sugar phosphate isomerase/epimerase [Verrucomicrobia bacterium]|nr:sugar phosphate isomerase/epimerase [Verrucomicrobiota bacterium]